MTRNFADTYFSKKDCAKIGYIREDIERNYKKGNLNNRRYLGNKYKLLSFITGVVNDECADIETVADIFAGTGAVSSAFVDKALITNDLMYSNYICNYAWFGAESYDQQKIIDYVVRYNA